MSAPTITTPPATPNRGSATFPSEVATFLSFFSPFVADINAFAAYLNSTVLVSYAFGDGTATLPTIRFSSDSNTGLYLPAADTLGFATGGAERMRITGAGNVGIGTSAPATKLDVIGGISRFSNISSNWLDINASAESGNDVELSTRFNSLSFDAKAGAGAPSLRFKTASLERMRIDNNGNLMVGTSSTGGAGGFVVQPNASNGGASVLMNRGAIIGTTVAFYFRDGGTNVGDIRYTNTAVSYNTSSDYRLKEDWRDIDAASARLMALKPVNFAWKADGKRVDGFLAHELAEVIPNAVTGEKDGEEMQSVDHSKIVPLLTAALQEALTKIDALEARLAKLEGE